MFPLGIRARPRRRCGGPYGDSRPTDARADAMGSGDAAMHGDVRHATNPAALVDINRLEQYHRYATPYLFLQSHL
ncbi:MAG: hypothetical protein IPL86_11760 [Flavobacteriales bacterium]|nr:hypothetical protein [Flavobacteriales bacterium]